MNWIMARTARQRPSLMHELIDVSRTRCGLDTQGWSVAYFSKAIPVLACKRCKVGSFQGE